MTGPPLAAFLERWLGTWPPELPLDVVAAPARDGSDGPEARLVGVLHPDPPELGEPGLLLSVPASRVDAVELLGGLDPDVLDEPAWRDALTQALGAPGARIEVAALRWCEHVGDLPPPGGADVPADVADRITLVRRAPGGVELVVARDVTDDEVDQLAGALVAAARQALADGDVPVLRHALEDATVAAAADRAGLGDRGLRIVGLTVPEQAPGPGRS